MKLNAFLSNSGVRLGNLYALNGNGYYYADGCSYNCARAKLEILRSYMQSLDTTILGVMLFGSAVKMPETVVLKQKKWFFFGPVVETTVKQHVKNINDFDIAIFTKDSQTPINAPGQVIDGYDFYAILSSGLHMMCLTPEEYHAGVEAGDSVALSLRDKGVMIMSEPDFALKNIGNEQLMASWGIDSRGNWDCTIRYKN